jgi:nitrite reductase/ring-hydroxylating ferredoxin subunit/uncharacterized membrane protein
MVERSRVVEDRVRDVGQQMLDMLGRQDWLDRPSYRLEHALTFVFAAFGGARERVSNFLHGTWLGHPLHPLLTSVPIGAMTTTVALDGADMLPGTSPGLRDASRFTLGVGILGSVGAAAAGLTDWQHTQEQNRRVGLVHGALNAAATSLYVASWWDRRRGRHVRGVAGTGLGYGITIASGYLGGSLVFGSGTGVDQSGARLDIQKWTPVLATTALQEGRPQRVEVDGVGLVLFRAGGKVLAVGEHCPHLGGPMSDGWIDRGELVCPWHGSRFAPVSGEVLRGPATAPLPCYPTRLRDGLIELRGAPTAVDAETGVAQ